MRIFLHTFVAMFLVLGLVTGSLSLASTFQPVNGPLRLGGIAGPEMTGTTEVHMAAVLTGKACKGLSQSANCTMNHTVPVSLGMSCCGCFPGDGEDLCRAPSDARVTAFGLSDVTGDSRAPVSLLKPPRA